METPDQKYITLHTGAKMPMVGLGVAWTHDKEVMSKSITEVGYRHIDTAAFYDNEELVGQAIQDAIEAGVPREELFITTKLWRDSFEDPVTSWKQSLEKLQLDYVDMYLIHWPHNEVDGAGNFKKNPIHKVWEGMEKWVELGLTKHIGVSNFHVQLIWDMLCYCNIKPACNQIELHPYLQESELVQFWQKYGIAIVAYSPLSSPGRPAGKEDEKNILEDPKIIEIATNQGKTPAQIVLAWNIQRDVVVIPKSAKVTRAQENFDSQFLTLSEDEIKQMSEFESNLRIFDPIEWGGTWGHVPVFF